MELSYQELATIIYTIVQIEDADLERTNDLIKYLLDSEKGSIKIGWRRNEDENR